MSSSTWRVIIVDDEPAARFALRSVLSSFTELELVAEVEEGQRAVAAIRKHRPDIVFLDIDMPGMNGFEVVDATKDLRYRLVFVTAHHGFALDAFDTHAADFLLKPVRPSLIDKCIKKIVRQEQLAIERRPPQPEEAKHLVLTESGLSRVVAHQHIVCVGPIGRYRKVVLTKAGEAVHGQGMLISDTTLDDFMVELNASGFLRVHKSYIVNARSIVALRIQNRRHFLEIQGYDEPVPVGRSHLKSVKAVFGL
jgi:DNA-binding LytR/AlgR family response regulator